MTMSAAAIQMMFMNSSSHSPDKLHCSCIHSAKCLVVASRCIREMFADEYYRSRRFDTALLREVQQVICHFCFTTALKQASSL